MADLLPSSPDTSAVEEADPRVIGVDSDDAEDTIGALSSGTARDVLAALHDEPANPAKLADAVDTTIQNAQYHLEKLEDAGLIEVVDTVYSEKGREMNVYAPSDRPLVVVAGREQDTSGLRAALSRLLGAVAALAVGSVVVQQLLAGNLLTLGAAVDREPADGAGEATGTEAVYDAAGTDGGANATATEAPQDTPTEAARDTGAGTPTPEPEATGTPTPTEAPMGDAVETVTEVPAVAAQTGLDVEPGVLFFAGGLTVLALLVAVQYVRG